jgi:UDP-N-acetylglucosamine 2-epimerase (non-hydrolysing)
VTEQSGVDNLLHEGIDPAKIKLVGNVMIDTLKAWLPEAQQRATARGLGLDPGQYGFVTLHRPSNVDDPGTLRRLLELINELSMEVPLVFAMHPRTRAAADRMGANGLLDGNARLRCLGPQPYLDTLSLVSTAKVVLTDSGGLQEETAVLGVPCLTLRDNTERPITTTLGTSRLVGNDSEKIRAAFREVVAGRWPHGEPIPLWDGNAGAGVATELASWLGQATEVEEAPVATII